MTQQVVIHNIAAAMETLGGIAEHIPADIADVGEFVAARLAAGRTLYCLGDELTHPLCEYFRRLMITEATMERPALPCINLQALPQQSTFFSGSAAERELSALCGPGDVLLVISNTLSPNVLTELIQQAQGKQMTVILGGTIDRQCYAALSEHDFVIALNTTSLIHSHQLQLLFLQNLHDTVEQQLFGGFHRES